MMDVATIVITASANTLVLLIVVIALVIDTRKRIGKEPPDEPQASHNPREIRKPKEAENRLSRKPAQDNKSRSPAVQPQNVDQVERSLRDINLRLKNAERDQEKELKRIKDSMGPSVPRKFDQQKPREHNEGFRRTDRPRQEFNQSRNGDSQRRPREDKEAQKPIPEMREAAPAPTAPSMVVPPTPPVTIAASVPPIITEPIFEAAQNVPEPQENLQHGRKVMVKRRILNLEEVKPGDTNENGQGSASSSPEDGLLEVKPEGAGISEVQSPSVNEEEPLDGAAISFGR